MAFMSRFPFLLSCLLKNFNVHQTAHLPVPFLNISIRDSHATWRAKVNYILLLGRLVTKNQFPKLCRGKFQPQIKNSFASGSAFFIWPVFQMFEIYLHLGNPITTQYRHNFENK